MLKTRSRLLIKLTFTLLVVGFAIVGPSSTTRVAHASPCTDCWDGCGLEESTCNEFCAGCPYEDERSFQHSSGHTVNCAGGVGQCMSNCHYASMICYDNCTYSSCGFPKDR
jgi:hypothetical protein